MRWKKAAQTPRRVLVQRSERVVVPARELHPRRAAVEDFFRVAKATATVTRCLMKHADCFDRLLLAYLLFNRLDGVCQRDFRPRLGARPMNAKCSAFISDEGCPAESKFHRP